MAVMMLCGGEKKNQGMKCVFICVCVCMKMCWLPESMAATKCYFSLVIHFSDDTI